MPTDLLADDQNQGAPARDLLTPDTATHSAPASSWTTLGENALAGAGETLTGYVGRSLDALNPVHQIASLADATSRLISGRGLGLPDTSAGHAINQSLGVVGKATGIGDLNPEDVKAHNWQERLARHAGAGATSVVLPGGPVRNLVMGLSGAVGQTLGEEGAHAIAPGYEGVGGTLGAIAGGGLASIPSLVGSITRRMVGAGPNAPANIADFNAAGVRPVAGAVLDNPHLTTLESGFLSKSPGAGNIYYGPQGVYPGANQDLETAVDSLANEYGNKSGKGIGVQTPEGLSSVVAKGATEAGQRVRARQDTIYTAALKPVDNMNIPQRSMSSLETLSSDWTDRLSQNPESLEYIPPMLGRLNGILRDVAAGNSTIRSLRNVRTDIGYELSDPVIVGVSSAQAPYLKQLYGALSEDIAKNATNLDQTGTVAKNLSAADRYTRLMNQRLNIIQDVMGGKVNGQLYQALINSGNVKSGGGQILRAFRKTLTKDQWDAVAGTTLGRMGLAPPAQQAASAVGAVADTFSPSTFMKNWEGMSPEAQQTFFGGTRYAPLIPKLTRLVRVAGGLEHVAQAGAGSPTAYRAAHYGLMSLMGGTAAANLLAGRPIAAITEPAAIFMGGYVAPKMAAKLMTNPQFIDWLANRATARTPASIARANKVLHTLAATNPVISAYLQSLQQQGANQ